MARNTAELPRSVRKGPPITVKCECGQKRELKYGERWTCEGCGRSYDTSKIPAEEYAALGAARPREWILPGVVIAALCAIALALVVSGRTLAIFLVVPIASYAWGIFVRPARRRRHYREVHELRHRWKIKAD